MATDIAARGIDILRISHVINYDMPEDIDAYIHRIGRTGRINKTGDALTFVTSADTAMVRSLELNLKTKLERRMLQNFDYRAPVASSDVKQTLPYRQTTRPGVRRKSFSNRSLKGSMCS